MNDVNQRFKPSMLQNHFDTRIYAFNALLYLRPARILLTVLLGLRSDTQGSIVKDSACVDGRKHRQILIFGQNAKLATHVCQFGRNVSSKLGMVVQWRIYSVH